MAKKTVLTFLLLCGVVVSAGFADVTAQLDEALKYKRLQNLGKAEQIYQEIIADNPSSDAVVRAKIGLARMYHRQARIHNLPEQYGKAEALYKEVLADSGGIENAIAAQRYLTNMYLAKGDAAKVQSSLNTLTTSYPNCVELYRAVLHIARKYEHYKQYDKAGNVYRHILDNYPESSAAVCARLGVPRMNVLTLIDSGNDNAANVAIDNLIVDYAGYSYMPTALIQIGERYQKKGEAAKAIAIWEKVIEQLPDSDMAAEADNLAGYGYRQLGQYGKSVECYQRVANNHPESRLAGHSLFMLGLNYGQMGKTGLISKSAAGAEIERAYGKMVRDYPNCGAAKAAQRWIEKNGSK